MNIRLISLLLITLPIPSYADYFDDNYIFGISLIRQYAETELTNNATATELANNSTTSDKGSGLGLYLDLYIEHTFRFNSTLSYVNYDQFDILGMTGSIDYLIPVTTNFSLFAGAAIGGATQKFDSDVFRESAASALYGGQLGGIKYLSDSNLIEIGFRLRETDLVATNTTTTTTIYNLNEFYFSLLFMF